MLKILASVVAVSMASVPAAFAADISAARTWSEVTMEQPTNTAMPGASGATHQHYRDAVRKPVSADAVETIRQLAIAAGQTSRSDPEKDTKPQMSEHDRTTIEKSREAFFARIRERSGS